MGLIARDLSEPYSVYTYRYFLHNWPHLSFIARTTAPSSSSAQSESEQSTRQPEVHKKPEKPGSSEDSPTKPSSPEAKTKDGSSAEETEAASSSSTSGGRSIPVGTAVGVIVCKLRFPFAFHVRGPSLAP